MRDDLIAEMRCYGLSGVNPTQGPRRSHRQPSHGGGQLLYKVVAGIQPA